MDRYTLVSLNLFICLLVRIVKICFFLLKSFKYLKFIASNNFRSLKVICFSNNIFDKITHSNKIPKLKLVNLQRALSFGWLIGEKWPFLTVLGKTNRPY